MFSLISKLQKEPEYKRRRVAFLLAFFITIIIAFFWVFSFSSKTIINEAKIDEPNGPLSSFINIVKSSFENLKEGFSKQF